jgi:hypothetical protein
MAIIYDLLYLFMYLLVLWIELSVLYVLAKYSITGAKSPAPLPLFGDRVLPLSLPGLVLNSLSSCLYLPGFWELQVCSTMSCP